MWIVKIALDRPYTFIVLAFSLLLFGVLTILRTPIDIFPQINIPVVSVVWQYSGLPPDEMSTRIVANFERAVTTTVNDVEHIESQSLPSTGLVKIFFQPNVNLDVALSQTTAIAQTLLRFLPPGATPPLIVSYNASSVPVIQLGLSSSKLTEQELYDLGNSFIRTQLATVQGAAIPFPYGGKQRQVQVDINLPALQSKGLTPADIVTAMGSQSIILPSGTTKIGPFEYQVETNSAPPQIAELNNLPIRSVNGAMVYMHDIGHIRDGFPPQTNIVRVDGQRASLLSVIKTGDTSTLEIVKGLGAKLDQLKNELPPNLRITPLADQSIFVRASISGVVREGVIAACLTAIMILVFLGSWRSTIIVAVSIPLSILSSLLVLSALGETINIMTLGGLALAVGILVDDATVEVENINRNLEMGKAIEQAILDGAAQIAVPALVATLSICIVFVPMFFLGGVPRYLFVPLAEAVVFAMLASYLLSRTVVPTMARYLLQEMDDEAEERKHASRNPLVRFQLGFEHYFEKFRGGYRRILELCIAHSGVFLIFFIVFALVSAAALFPFLGEDFFPSVDAGQFKFHVRAHTGTRIEDVADLCDKVDNTIREVIPQDELVTIIDNIGLPYSGINLSYSNSGQIGPADADIQVSLSEHHHPTDAYVQKLRRVLNERFPGVTFYTLPTDMVSQILNFGLPAPIDVQIVGHDMYGDRDVAEQLMNRMKQVPGTADLRIQQPFNNPELMVNVDRTKASQLGLQQRDVTNSLLTALSGSFQTAPNFWLDPVNGVSYQIAVQSPQYQLDTMQDVQNIPVTASNVAPISPAPSPNGMLTSATYSPTIGPSSQILGNVAAVVPGQEPGTVTHYNIAPVIDIYGNVVNTDLASVSSQIDKLVADARHHLPRGSQIIIRGQVVTMRSSFEGLLGGLIFSVLLVYLLIVVNFQSWLDPFIIISALPAAISGIVWFLFVTHTRISVPALTGAIMCMGVATSNSILVISFAREQLEETVGDAQAAALSAGYVRFRPVLMTALAMIIGMVPMALGLGEGGEQNAPLGRAVIGGLLFATVSTLFFVPTFFSVLHGRLERRRREREAKEHQQAAPSEK
ncbi:MAG: efflux RND transporter permease subunit [Silvibacterium sp.]|nr:efflux RND transporter permease subunit [Silvibacterium sp.]